MKKYVKSMLITAILATVVLSMTVYPASAAQGDYIFYGQNGYYKCSADASVTEIEDGFEMHFPALQIQKKSVVAAYTIDASAQEISFDYKITDIAGIRAVSFGIYFQDIYDASPDFLENVNLDKVSLDNTAVDGFQFINQFINETWATNQFRVKTWLRAKKQDLFINDEHSKNGNTNYRGSVYNLIAGNFVNIKINNDAENSKYTLTVTSVYSDTNNEIVLDVPYNKIFSNGEGWQHDPTLAFYVFNENTVADMTAEPTVTVKNAPSKNKVSFIGAGDIRAQFVSSGRTILQPTDPVMTGKVFRGWYADSEFQTAFDFNNTQITQNTTLYAKWEDRYYNVTFNGANVDPQSVIHNGKVTEPDDPVMTGKVFRGWYANPEFTAEFDFDNAQITQDTIIYAKWEDIYYTVTFNGANVDPQSVKHNLKAQKPEDPKRDGYRFEGWYNGNQLYDFNSPVVSNITLTAKWTKEKGCFGAIGFTEIGLVMMLLASAIAVKAKRNE